VDGIGDLPGLTSKLDYLQRLEIDCVWLLPMYPSPLRDDGYDISDYNDVHPDCGTLQDFRVFLREAHRLGLKVVTELVLNHTSDQHAWFQRARRALPGSRHRDYYVWSDSPDRFAEARVIFQDFERSNWTWDPVARAYYWHRFYAHQPDLNFDNPAVRRSMLQALDFWLGLGVDGLRLDAVPYLFEREGTSCENLPETHDFLRQLRQHVDRRFANRMLLAEANQWPEDAVAYFGKSDESHMAFHFPLMPRLFMALELEDRFPIIDILEQTPEIPDDCQWALFLRNHDELTLEMVTDEDRDYMYRVYAADPKARINLGIRRRLAPLLGARRKVELMKALLLSLPGTPVVYYGDEIGMGDNIYLGDRHGVRTPMQWSSDRNAGFSRANPQSLFLPIVIDPEYHYEAVNIEAQQKNPNSLLWWNKRILALRNRYRAFGRGRLELLHPDNRKVLAYMRTYDSEVILVAANLSRYAQHAELNLSSYRGLVPVELFGNSAFPPIGDAPYGMTLAPHGFYWLALVAPRPSTREGEAEMELSTFEVEDSWTRLLRWPARAALEEVLARHVPKRRWFRGKARAIKDVHVRDVIEVGTEIGLAAIVLLNVEYQDREPESYVLPLTFVSGEHATRVQDEHPSAVVARMVVRSSDGAEHEGLLVGALAEPAFSRTLLTALVAKARLAGQSGTLVFHQYSAFPQPAPAEAEPRLGRVEQSNSSVTFGDNLILKIMRRLEPGVNPELEMGLFLSERQHAAQVAPLAGAITYESWRAEPLTIAVAHSFVPNQGDAWSYTIDALGRFYEWAAARPTEAVQSVQLPKGTAGLWEDEMPALAIEGMGPFLTQMRLLGQRTAELHQTLSADSEDRAFAPEPFTTHYQRSLYEFMRTRAQLSLQLLRSRLGDIPEPARLLAREVLERGPIAAEGFRVLTRRRITALRIRCHGDFHLGQVLYTGNDFVIIDFEGEPDRALGERRFKRPIMSDLAGMLRSFHYAAAAALRRQLRDEDVAVLKPWADFWQGWTSAAFVRGYLETARGAIFMPKFTDELALLLELYVLEKAFYEVGYELNNRPAWVDIPLTGLLQYLVATHASDR
jgi:maltose alpha-D-glucosyltransferase / alpha-amylase